MPGWAWLLIGLVCGGLVAGVAVVYWMGHGMFRNL
jgi:hypothetical protein